MAGYTTPMQTQCFGSGYSTNCITTGGQYIPPTFMAVDANNDARNSDARSCLYENGWTPETREQARARSAAAETQASDTNARLAAGAACIASGIKPDDRGYYQCFQAHMRP